VVADGDKPIASSSLATKTDTPLLETPRGVTVVDRKVLDDLQAISITQAHDYVPSFSPQDEPGPAFSRGARYRFPGGLSHFALAAGVVHVSERFADRANTVRMPAYTRFDVNAFVGPFARRLQFALVAANLANTRYVTSGAAVFFAGPPGAWPRRSPLGSKAGIELEIHAGARNDRATRKKANDGVRAMTSSAASTAHPDFSLVLGGPLYQAFRRSRLSGDGLELLRRRVLVLAGLAWLPLLLLTALAGQALGGPTGLSFLRDIEAHVRFLIALPALIGAELLVHLRLRPVVAQFVERRIVSPEDLPRFDRAIRSTLRLRNSMVVEIALLAFVYSVGLWVWKNEIALGTASWYATPDGAQLHLTPAGVWYAYVSVPIFQFILLRWYFRLFLWFSFLFRVSRLNLRLAPSHPDRSAGLSFLGRGSYAFAPILFAQSALLSGWIASQIFYAGQNLMAFKTEIGAFVAFFVAVVLTPLAVFAPGLARAKREGLGSFGRLSSRYVGEFEEKWFRGGAPPDEPLLGSADIQSLADLGNSYQVVREMRLVPFGWKDVTRLAAGAAVPLLPLALTILSLEELVARLLKVLL